MSLDKGFIKLYRDLRDHLIWDDKPYSRGQAWIDLLFRANYKDSKMIINGRFRTIKRGQIFTSIGKLGTAWGWSDKKVRLFLSELQKENMVKTKGTAEGTTLTIVKYGFYQDQGQAKGRTKDTTEDEPKTSQRRAEDRHLKNSKEGKESKEKKEDDFIEEWKTPEELAEEGWE